MYHSTCDLFIQFSNIFDTSNSDKAVFIVAVLLCNFCDQTKYIYLVVPALLRSYNRYTDSDREM